MLNSYTKWQTLQGNAQLEISPNEAQTEAYALFFIEIALEQPGKGYLATSMKEQAPSYIWVSDGSTIWHENLEKSIYFTEEAPEDISSPESFGPSYLPDDNRSFAIPHPMSGIMPSPVANYIYPQGIAQSHSNWDAKILGEETIAKRKAIVVQFQLLNEAGAIMKQHKFWVDTETGMILQGQIFVESSGWSEWAEQISFTEINYDQPSDNQKFVFEPNPSVRQVTSEEFLSQNSR
jgi:outer membrane lipoprotein-sorting protein